ncbi:MAG: hypothetical protein HZC41_08290 [Chloroflexi bacterium]|nr:hypothetical protein [Chloroflexota bacterium]
MASLAHLPTLDERWLEFARCAQPVFAVHPELVPLRQTIFKQFVEQQTTFTARQRFKQWARLALRQKRSQGDLSPVEVVFWLDSSREVLTEALLPVVREVTAGGVQVALITSPTVQRQIQLTPPPITFSVPARWQPSSRWRAGWHALREIFPDALHPASFDAFCDLASAAANTVEEVKRLLSQLRPRLLVLAADHLLPGSAAAAAARDLGIESLVLLHGAVSPYNAPLTADRMGVWGEVSFDQMVQLGVPPEQLVVLGSPRHDSFPAVPADARQRFRDTLGLRDLPCLVFFSNGNDLRRNSRVAVEGCARWLNTAAAALPDRMEVAVRLHPNEDGSLYANSPLLHVFKHECDLATTLSAADVCAALCSTTLVDALLYNKPVLQFYAEGWPNLADNWRRGLSLRIADETQLVDFLSAGMGRWQTLAAEQAQQVDSVFAHRGRARQAVADYLVGRARRMA